MQNPEQYLEECGIEYELYEHPAVMTCDEAAAHDIPGLSCKNLFLRDKKGRRFLLLVVPASKRVDLGRLAELAGEKKLSFASEENLREKLGLSSGAVSVFGLLNDANGDVELFLDQEVSGANSVSFHPNRNTASLVLSREMFQKYLDCIDHTANDLIL